MELDVYWEWLRLPTDRRPPSFFDLLGLPSTEDDPAAIERAAHQQVLRVKEHLDGPQAALGARLLQEITLAKNTLLDPAQRAAYRASLPAKTESPNWWKDELRVSSAKGERVVKPEKPLPGARPRRPNEFAEISPGPRRRKSGGGIGIGLVILIGGAIVGLVGIGVAVVVILLASSSTPSPTTDMVVNATPTASTTPTPPTSFSSPSRANPPSRANVPTTPSIPATPTTPGPTEPAPQGDPPAAGGDPVVPTGPKSFPGHTGLVQAIALTPDGRRFLSAGDTRVLDWSLDGGKPYVRQTFKVPALGVGVLPGGKLAVSGDEGGIVLISLSQNKVQKTFKNPRGQVLALAAAADGMHVLTGGSDGTLLWWNVNRDAPEAQIDIGDNVSASCVAVSGDSKFVAAGTNDGGVGVWEVAPRRRMWQFKHHAAGVTSVAFSPDGKYLATTAADLSVTVWDAATGKNVRRFPGHDNLALCVAWLEKPGGLVSGGKDSAIKVWSLESATAVRTLTADAPVYCLAVGPKDAYLIAGGFNGNLQLILMPTLDLEALVQEKPPAEKLPAPEAAEVEAAVKSIREQFKTEYASGAPNEMVVLADRLFERSTARATPPQRFAYFREARDAAAKAGKFALVYKIIETQDKWFEIDELTDRATALGALAATVPPAGAKEIVDAAAKLLERVEKDKRNDLVQPLFDAMAQAATRSGSAELAKWVGGQRAARVQQTRTLSKLEELQAKLKERPSDPDANRDYGLILCSQNNWKEGLQHISKGSDYKLGIIADQDLAGPKDPAAQKEMADTWIAQAAKMEPYKVAFLTRAKYWMEQAKAGLTGTERLDAITRINKIDEQLKAASNAMPKDPPSTAPKPAVATNPKPKSSEPVVRKNFATLRNETTLKANWKVDGSSRNEVGGIRLLANPVSMTSAFQLVDNWRIEILLGTYDGREIEFEVNGQLIPLKPTRAPSTIVLERKGKKLGYALNTGSTFSSGQNIVLLADDKLGPSALTIRMSGQSFLSKKDEGMLFASINITGLVKVEE